MNSNKNPTHVFSLIKPLSREEVGAAIAHPNLLVSLFCARPVGVASVKIRLYVKVMSVAAEEGNKSGFIIDGVATIDSRDPKVLGTSYNLNAYVRMNDLLETRESWGEVRLFEG